MLFRARFLTELIHGRFLLCYAAISTDRVYTREREASEKQLPDVAMWHLQVMSALRGAQLAGYIKPTAHPLEMYLTPVKGDGEKGDDDKKPHIPNPDYETWIAKDQQVSELFVILLFQRDLLSSYIFSGYRGHCMGRH
jgi:hypothetical protein